MPKRAKGLSAVALKTLPPGRHADGGGLYAVIAPGSRTWMFRYQRDGLRREMGLGTMEAVSLAAARQRAREARERLAAGDDPVEARKALAASQRVLAAPAPVTFAQAVDAYLAQHAPTWRSDKTLAAWSNTLRAHAGPKLGSMPVAEIGREHVLGVLQPLWRDHHETARKTRLRIEAVLDFATAKGWRPDTANPARWRGGLNKLLGNRPVDAKTRHYPALPYVQAPAFMVALRQRDAMAARMLEWVILTACRSGEARGARWREVETGQGTWTIPPPRTKTGVEHRVPLSAPALALLHGLLPEDGKPDPDALVFPGPGGEMHSVMAMAALLDRMQTGAEGGAPRWRDKDGRPITVHGFRSTFRTWAGELAVEHPREVVEAALAHHVGDQVERAYARGDLFARRARLMAQWADFLSPSTAEVVPLNVKVSRGS